MKKKVVSVLLMTALAVGTLAGCGGGGVYSCTDGWHGR